MVKCELDSRKEGFVRVGYVIKTHLIRIFSKRIFSVSRENLQTSDFYAIRQTDNHTYR